MSFPEQRTPLNDRGTLVRFALLAWRRTLPDNSTRLLVVATALFALAETAWRVRSPHGGDAWLVCAVLWAITLPSLIAHDEALQSTRIALLPISHSALRRASLIAGSPERLLLVLAIPLLGATTAVPTNGATILALAGWALLALVTGVALEAWMHHTASVITRPIAALGAAIGMWCLWSLRTSTLFTTAGSTLFLLPPLLPRDGTPLAWLCATLTCITGIVALGFWLAPTTRVLASPNQLVTQERQQRTVTVGTAFDRGITRLGALIPPRQQRELLLLSRHVATLTSLAVVALLACAAAYGRVPGLALAAALPMAILTANVLGADIVIGGEIRLALMPEPASALRDRRLTAWMLATLTCGFIGTVIGLMLPAPASRGAPVGGALAAPTMFVFATSLVPWFGRAGWWWAQRYPQPMRQRVDRAGVQRATARPIGPIHLALLLMGAWTAVAMLAAGTLAACASLARFVGRRFVLDRVTPGALAVETDWIWLSGVLFAAFVASSAHLALAHLALARNAGDRPSASLERAGTIRL